MNTTARAARVAAAGLLGALALTACDSGSGSGSGHSTSATPGASTSATAGDSAGTSGTGGGSGTGGTTAKGGELTGSWLATSGGKAVVLMITGDQAALFSTDRTTCTGTRREESGKDVIHLRACKARTTGTVDSVNKTTLRVTWEGGLGRETYTRSEGAALPSGLPTASLGS
ncbi:hypothetical protein [Streptomyces carpinensis]|uniref:Lipoprotein n=1 Tax=Streptomyces carpinensis TaxID=66369 RepID=A0ABV1W1R2_9ACTN|nr:hypothetical protein [Streptomyces carpinensis]